MAFDKTNQRCQENNFIYTRDTWIPVCKHLQRRRYNPLGRIMRGYGVLVIGLLQKQDANTNTNVYSCKCHYSSILYLSASATFYVECKREMVRVGSGLQFQGRRNIPLGHTRYRRRQAGRVEECNRCRKVSAYRIVRRRSAQYQWRQRW